MVEELIAVEPSGENRRLGARLTRLCQFTRLQWGALPAAIREGVLKAEQLEPAAAQCLREGV